jgi:hypothetical protein
MQRQPLPVHILRLTADKKALKAAPYTTTISIMPSIVSRRGNARERVTIVVIKTEAEKNVTAVVGLRRKATVSEQWASANVSPAARRLVASDRWS